MSVSENTGPDSSRWASVMFVVFFPNHRSMGPVQCLCSLCFCFSAGVLIANVAGFTRGCWHAKETLFEDLFIQMINGFPWIPFHHQTRVRFRLISVAVDHVGGRVQGLCPKARV